MVRVPRLPPQIVRVPRHDAHAPRLRRRVRQRHPRADEPRRVRVEIPRLRRRVVAVRKPEVRPRRRHRRARRRRRARGGRVPPTERPRERARLEDEGIIVVVLVVLVVSGGASFRGRSFGFFRRRPRVIPAPRSNRQRRLGDVEEAIDHRPRGVEREHGNRGPTRGDQRVHGVREVVQGGRSTFGRRRRG